jgi:hypothetical protein
MRTQEQVEPLTEARDPSRHHNVWCCQFSYECVYITIISAIFLAISTITLVVALIQLQRFTSTKAFNAGVQESIRAHNVNAGHSMIMRETEGLRLLLLIQRMRAAETVSLLHMLFAAQREIAVKHKGSNLFGVIHSYTEFAKNTTESFHVAVDIITRVHSVSDAFKKHLLMTSARKSYEETIVDWMHNMTDMSEFPVRYMPVHR